MSRKKKKKNNNGNGNHTGAGDHPKNKKSSLNGSGPPYWDDEWIPLSEWLKKWAEEDDEKS